MPELKLKADSPMEKVFLTYLTANASDVLAAKIDAGVKTLAGACKYITEEARKVKVGEMAMVDDATVYGWLIHFFEEDSIEEPTIRKPVRSVPASVKVIVPPPKKVDPQMSLFDNMMGVTKKDEKTEPIGAEADPDMGLSESDSEPDDGEAFEPDPDCEDPDSDED